MKSKHKALLLTLCAVLLVAATAFGTLAYLTDTEAVTNTFTVGSVYLKLDEADVKPDGTIDTNNRVQENEYHLLPGHTYIKDPTVTILADSEDSYVRALVTVTDYDDLANVCNKHRLEWEDGKVYVENSGGNDTVLLQYFTTGIGSGWVYHGVTFDGTANTATYEFRYANKTTKSSEDQKLPALFEKIVMPGWMDNDDLKVLSAGYQWSWGSNGLANGKYVVEETTNYGADAISINVVAHAIQADGFDTADEAWAAFKQ